MNSKDSLRTRMCTIILAGARPEMNSEAMIIYLQRFYIFPLWPHANVCMLNSNCRQSLHMSLFIPPFMLLHQQEILILADLLNDGQTTFSFRLYPILVSLLLHHASFQEQKAAYLIPYQPKKITVSLCMVLQKLIATIMCRQLGDLQQGIPGSASTQGF